MQMGQVVMEEPVNRWLNNGKCDGANGAKPDLTGASLLNASNLRINALCFIFSNNHGRFHTAYRLFRIKLLPLSFPSRYWILARDKPLTVSDHVNNSGTARNDLSTHRFFSRLLCKLQLHVTFHIVADVRLPSGMLNGALRACFCGHTPERLRSFLTGCLHACLGALVVTFG